MMYSTFLGGKSGADQEDWEFVEDHDHGFGGPRTPSTLSENHDNDGDQPPTNFDTSDPGSDEDYGEASQATRRQKKGGYDSRIEQILYENPDLPILIVDAGKSSESGGKYIVYTIRTGVRARC
jgi:hypothetical protein